MSKSKQTLVKLALAGLGVVMSGTALAAGGMMVDSNGGIVVGNPDGDYWARIGGMLQFDQAFFSSEARATGGIATPLSLKSGSNIRRAYLSVGGGVGQDWTYNMRVNFAESHIADPAAGTAAVAGSDVLDAYVTYHGFENAYVKVGQAMPYLGMDQATSASDTAFMERALISKMVRPDYSLGLFAGYEYDMVNLQAAVFHPADKKATSYGTGHRHSDMVGYMARMTFVPVMDDEQVLHFGVTGYHQDHAGDTGANKQFSASHELVARNYLAVSQYQTGTISAVKDFDIYNFEVAGQWNSWTAQAEYYTVGVDRAAGSANGDYDFTGYYVQLSYVLTGEKRPYDFSTGSFGRVTPASADGAWEVGVRYGMADFRDKGLRPTGAANNADVAFGAEHSTTVGVNYWMNDNVSLAANYVRAVIPRSNWKSEATDMFGLRVQVDF